MTSGSAFRPDACTDERAGHVLRFWFGDRDHYGAKRKAWFEKDAAFDAEIRAQFLTLHTQAADGILDAWRELRAECLALIVVLDQFSRNLYRNDARAFANDAKALAAARGALERGYDRDLMPVERMFLYLPFEHSESIEDQERSCALMRALDAFPETADVYGYAERHREVITRFGRFPHRNAALGRVSTPAEAEYLAQPGAGF